MILDGLAEKEKFSRQDYVLAYQDQFNEYNPYVIEYALRKSVSEGEILHVGRDQYTVSNKKRVYRYQYSAEAVQIASDIRKDYPEVDFRIFELVQLNAFVNHLYAHNTIFVYVENDVIEFVFDTLHHKYPGKVLFKPKREEYYRYLVDNQIVILRLPTETPRGIDKDWHSRLEKILVDIVVDKLLSKIVSSSEYNAIFTEAYERYLIDEKGMFRYANRRGAGSKFRESLEEYTSP